jgi:hypothetical protein
MKDAFTWYETGIRRLLEQIGSDHSRYTEALTLQLRLLEEIVALVRDFLSGLDERQKTCFLYPVAQGARRLVVVQFYELLVERTIGGWIAITTPRLACFAKDPGHPARAGARGRLFERYYQDLFARLLPLFGAQG